MKPRTTVHATMGHSSDRVPGMNLHTFTGELHYRDIITSHLGCPRCAGELCFTGMENVELTTIGAPHHVV